MTEENTFKHAYTPLEAMKLIGGSRNWFYAAVERGDIPSIRVGRKILIPKKQFDAKFDPPTN